MAQGRFTVSSAPARQANRQRAQVNAQNAAIRRQERLRREQERKQRIQTMAMIAGMATGGLAMAPAGAAFSTGGAMFGASAGQLAGNVVTGQRTDPATVASLAMQGNQLMEQRASREATGDLNEALVNRAISQNQQSRAGAGVTPRQQPGAAAGEAGAMQSRPRSQAATRNIEGLRGLSEADLSRFDPGTVATLAQQMQPQPFTETIQRRMPGGRLEQTTTVDGQRTERQVSVPERQDRSGMWSVVDAEGRVRGQTRDPDAALTAANRIGGQAVKVGTDPIEGGGGTGDSGAFIAAVEQDPLAHTTTEGFAEQAGMTPDQVPREAREEMREIQDEAKQARFEDFLRANEDMPGPQVWNRFAERMRGEGHRLTRSQFSDVIKVHEKARQSRNAEQVGEAIAEVEKVANNPEAAPLEKYRAWQTANSNPNLQRNATPDQLERMNTLGDRIAKQGDQSDDRFKVTVPDGRGGRISVDDTQGGVPMSSARDVALRHGPEANIQPVTASTRTGAEQAAQAREQAEASRDEPRPRQFETFDPVNEYREAIQTLAPTEGRITEDAMSDLIEGGELNFDEVRRMNIDPEQAELRALENAQQRAEFGPYSGEQAERARAWIERKTQERTRRTVNMLPADIETVVQGNPDVNTGREAVNVLRNSLQDVRFLNTDAVNQRLDRFEEQFRAQEQQRGELVDDLSEGLSTREQRQIQRAPERQRPQVAAQLRREHARAFESINRLLDAEIAAGQRPAQQIWQGVQRRDDFQRLNETEQDLIRQYVFSGDKPDELVALRTRQGMGETERGNGQAQRQEQGRRRERQTGFTGSAAPPTTGTITNIGF